MKHAVIIKGNPKYLRRMPVHARSLYSKVIAILENRGYTVTLDPGLPKTRPNINADLWVGHSRGIDRLRFAPKNVQTLALETLSEDGNSPRHYILSKRDLLKLNRL